MKHFIFEDNYPLNMGDNYSFNHILHKHWLRDDVGSAQTGRVGPRNDALASIHYRDDFGRKQSTIRWDEHLAQFYFWRSMTQTVQFMPLLNYKSKREGYEDNHAELAEVTPVFTDEEFKSKYPDLFELPSQHNFICYVKIKDGINSRV